VLCTDATDDIDAYDTSDGTVSALDVARERYAGTDADGILSGHDSAISKRFQQVVISQTGKHYNDISSTLQVAQDRPSGR